MLYAVSIRYLESKYTGDGKWHKHTTKWYTNSDDAWDENDKFLSSRIDTIEESSSSILHK